MIFMRMNQESLIHGRILPAKYLRTIGETFLEIQGGYTPQAAFFELELIFGRAINEHMSISLKTSLFWKVMTGTKS